MHTWSKYPTLFFALLLVLLMEPLRVHAYIDPGSSGFLIQMLIASVVGLSVGVRTFWGRIRLLFSRKKDTLILREESKTIQDEV